MAQCVSCGSKIPDGQRNCSMCFGDVDHGKDGYYRDAMERDRQKREYEEQREPEQQDWSEDR